MNGIRDTRALCSEFAKGRSLLASGLALLGMDSVEEVDAFLADRQSRTGLFTGDPPTDHPDWLKFYTHPAYLEKQLFRGLLGEEEGDEARALLKLLRNPQTGTEEAQRELFALLVGLLTPMSYDKADDVSDALASLLELPEMEEEANDDNDIPPAFAFYLWIWIPCWLVYGCEVPQLLKRVKEGGAAAADAVEALVRLDHTSARMRYVKKWVEEQPGDRQPMVRVWKTSTPFRKPRKNTAALGICSAWVAGITNLIDDRPDAGELKELCIDLSESRADDIAELCLSKTNDDFGRMIRQYLSKLSMLAPPDKNWIETIRGCAR
ncbi:hypothetical protein [Aeoliella mucimassa]|uniref:Uncharacterized protein n=1 Tax=Aeoliella mucimassa TaxID=2527972 RepID=A0A518APU6_9BACT|nr:hypothetical protein [Aeoliella mucimassa]QDU56744.1 hypothetical protein Pan181_29540 [Aeoliella mucimassa]